MSLTPLSAISPIDGRYFQITSPLSSYFSEYALIQYRLRIEVEYFIALCELPLPQLKGIQVGAFESLRNLYLNFTSEDAQVIKETEKVTNHDVKAVEYFIKNKFDALGLEAYKEFFQFAYQTNQGF